MTESTDIKLNESVNQQMSAIISEGFIEKTIKAQLEKTISDIIPNSLGIYSDFGNAIKDKINSVLPLAASNVELPEYNKFVSDICIQTFDKVLHEQAKQQIETLLKADIGIMESNSLTAQDIHNKLVECFEPDEFEDERDIKVTFEKNERGTIYLVVKDEEEHEEIKVTFYDHSRMDEPSGYIVGYINSCGWREQTSRKSVRALNTYCMDEIEKFFFRLYCAQTKIDMSNADFESFTVGGYDY